MHLALRPIPLSLGPVYQAETDGFVVASILIPSNDGQAYLSGYTDSSNPPTTVRAYAGDSNTVSDDMTPNSFTMPVRKGDYWEVVRTYVQGSSSTVIIYWIPLGA